MRLQVVEQLRGAVVAGCAGARVGKAVVGDVACQQRGQLVEEEEGYVDLCLSVSPPQQ